MTDIEKAILLLVENGYRVEKVQCTITQMGLVNEVATLEQLNLLNSPIESLNIGVRAINCLEPEGIKTVRDLISRTNNELLRTPNLGRKSLTEVKLALHAVGLSLKPDF